MQWKLFRARKKIWNSIGLIYLTTKQLNCFLVTLKNKGSLLHLWFHNGKIFVLDLDFFSLFIIFLDFVNDIHIKNVIKKTFVLFISVAPPLSALLLVFCLPFVFSQHECKLVEFINDIVMISASNITMLIMITFVNSGLCKSTSLAD